MMSILFSGVTVLILACAAMALTWRASPEMITMTWLVAAIAPFALTRDFVRRFDFAHLATGRVLLLDCTAAIIQLSLLAWLGLPLDQRKPQSG